MPFDVLKRSASQLRSDLDSARGMLSLVAGLPKFFREQITLAQAQDEMKRALQNREQRFLELVRTHVYGRHNSPYLKLLHLAGCDFADLQSQVGRMGLERTLEQLAEEGVYLTSDEFKGKTDVVRRGCSFRVFRKDIQTRNLDRGLLLTQSSGSRSQPQRYAISLKNSRESNIVRSIFFSAHDLFHHSHAIYDAILPTSGGIRDLLGFAKCQIIADRWFAHRVPLNSWPEATFHHAMTSLIVLAAKFFGPGAPSPELLDSHELGRIVTWMAEQRTLGKPACLRSTASNGVRVARIAQDMGQSLEGCSFIVSGEPLTESKRAAIESVNARAIPCYGCAGLGAIGWGCGNPGYTDEVHVSTHRLSVIKRPQSLDNHQFPIHPFLFTTLSLGSPILHINVENGDFGEIGHRDCGCALEIAGLTLHLHEIRSYEKLTSEGMNYYYSDLYEFLETTFPCEFGGGPGDYQLVEEEDDTGRTRLTLMIHPAVGPLDEMQAIARLRAALADGSRNNRFMTWVWQDADTFRVKREPPYASARGKILPLHISQTKTTSRSKKAVAYRAPVT